MREFDRESAARILDSIEDYSGEILELEMVRLIGLVADMPGSGLEKSPLKADVTAMRADPYAWCERIFVSEVERLSRVLGVPVLFMRDIADDGDPVVLIRLVMLAVRHAAVRSIKKPKFLASRRTLHA